LHATADVQRDANGVIEDCSGASGGLPADSIGGGLPADSMGGVPPADSAGA
jgi:hypothetical protein